MKTARPYWAIPLTIICTLLAAFVGTLPAAILLDGSSPLRMIVGGLGVAVTAVVLVYFWRRLLLRRTGLGLRWNRSAIPQALIGIVVAATAAVAANAASVAAGAADWVPRSTYATSWSAYAVLATLSVSILMQGLPEELLWRGHLYDLLSTSWSPWMVLLVTSVSFGSVHILSQSDAQGTVERLLYVAMAIALGFASGAARMRTGTVWMAIGIHSGFHLGLRALPTEVSNYTVWLVILAATLTFAGALVLTRRSQPKALSDDSRTTYRESEAGHGSA